MPVKVSAYACKYRCGHRYYSTEDGAINHEKTCFSNPERKACKTCKYFDVDEDGSACEQGALPKGKFARWGCPSHERQPCQI